MLRRMRSCILAIFIISSISCYMVGTKIYLPGKIAVSPLGRNVYVVYNNSDLKSAEIKLKTDKQVWNDALMWLHKDDSFVGVEGFKKETGGTIKSNVVRFNLTGTIVDKIYDSRDGEIVGLAYPSRNDKYLLFTSERIGDPKVNPLEGLNAKQSFVILDFERKEVIKRLENIGSSLNIDLHESPWLYDEDSFIYTISNERKVSLEGTDINPIRDSSRGVYLYDLKTDAKKLLVPEARFGICSPVNGQIAYILDKSIWIQNINDGSKKSIYQAGSKEKITNLHWTPDGKYIYLAYYKNPGSEWFSSSDEKLIEISSGKEISFNKIGQGFNAYTWK